MSGISNLAPFKLYAVETHALFQLYCNVKHKSKTVLEGERFSPLVIKPSES